MSSTNAQLMSLFFCFLPPHSVSSRHTGPRFISRDWVGIRPSVDAAMVGRVFLNPKPLQSPPPPARKRSSRKKRPSKRRGHRGRQSRHVFDDLWSYDDWFDYSDYSVMTDESVTEETKSTPVQNVYFFKRGMNTQSYLLSQSGSQYETKLKTEAKITIMKTILFKLPPLTPFGLSVSFLFMMADKYYRVDLQTKRVDSANPAYPRSIAKYWLGCNHEETPGASRAEKR